MSTTPALKPRSSRGSGLPYRPWKRACNLSPRSPCTPLALSVLLRSVAAHSSPCGRLSSASCATDRALSADACRTNDLSARDSDAAAGCCSLARKAWCEDDEAAAAAGGGAVVAAAAGGGAASAGGAATTAAATGGAGGAVAAASAAAATLSIFVRVALVGMWAFVRNRLFGAPATRPSIASRQNGWRAGQPGAGTTQRAH